MAELCLIDRPDTSERLARVEVRLDELDRRLEQRFDMSDAATREFKRFVNEKFVASNEIRAALADTQNRMVTRTDLAALSARQDEIREDVEELRRGSAKLDGGRLVIMGIVAAAMGLIGALLLKVLWGS